MSDKQRANDNSEPTNQLTDPAANENYNLADDALCGAQEIADFLRKAQRGEEKASRRSVYHLVKTSRLPTYRLGGKIWARKSILLKWIENQEAQSVAETRKQA